MSLSDICCCFGATGNFKNDSSYKDENHEKQKLTRGASKRSVRRSATREAGEKKDSFSMSTMVWIKGLGKSKPPKEEQISRHKAMYGQQTQWQRQVAELQGILSRLRDSYASHKGDFALNRYEELKFMIKEAVRQFNIAEEQFKRQSFKRPAVGSESPSGARKQGAIAKLREAAESFASNNDEMQTRERDYGQMSGKQVAAETDQMRKDILSLKQEYYMVRDRLQKLNTEYETSKKLDPSKRYNQLKLLVKEATRS